jgi:hypothetical protein
LKGATLIYRRRYFSFVAKSSAESLAIVVIVELAPQNDAGQVLFTASSAENLRVDSAMGVLGRKKKLLAGNAAF